MPTLVYLDSHTFTGQCVGEWLQDRFPNFSIKILRDQEQIVTFENCGECLQTVIINAGSARCSSSWILSLTARIIEVLPDVPTVMLSGYEDVENVRMAFELGVRGYIPTSVTSLVAIEAIRLVCAGGTFVPAAAFVLRAGARDSPLIEDFTQRQMQILDCLRRGMANKAIAFELRLHTTTVKSHVRIIMKKLNATNRTHLAYLTKDWFDHVLATNAPGCRPPTNRLENVRAPFP